MDHYTVTKLFRVPIGHRLSKHKGLCHNPHGHNIKIEVKLSSAILDDNDMIIDFKNFKEIVNRDVIDCLDHCMIVNEEDKEIIKYLKKGKHKHLKVPFDPTAERISKKIF